MTTIAIAELTSNQRGRTAEYAVAFDLTKLGYDVTMANEGLPYDLLADKNGVIHRIQVKTVRIRERDGIRWRVIDCTNGSREVYSDVDVYAGYEPNSGHVYYITHDDLDGKKELWLSPSRIYEIE